MASSEENEVSEGGALIEVRKLASAIKEAPALAAPRKRAAVDSMLSKLTRHAGEVARSDAPLANEQDIRDCKGAIVELLEALETCAGRVQLHTRTVSIAMAANRLISVMCFGEEGVGPEEKKSLLERVQRIRKAAACRSCPEKPAVSLALVGLQLTQLEAGVVCLPNKGEVGRAAMAAGRVVLGAIRSFATMKLDEDVLRGTKELLETGGRAARRRYAQPCYDELLLVDSVGCDRKLSASSEMSFLELLALRERHFGTYSNGRWEAKASVVWATSEALVGSSGRGISQLDVDLVKELCVGDEGGLVSVIGLGDPLGETRDRAATAMATVSLLGGQLIEIVAGGLKEAELREWMEVLVETLHEQLRGVSASLQGSLRGQLERLITAAESEAAGGVEAMLEACRVMRAALDQVGKASARAAKVLGKGMRMLVMVEGAVKGVDEARAVQAFITTAAAHLSSVETLARELSEAASGVAIVLASELIEPLAPAGDEVAAGPTQSKGMFSLMPKVSVPGFGRSKKKVGGAVAGRGAGGGEAQPDNGALEGRASAARARLTHLGTAVARMLDEAADGASEASLSLELSAEPLAGPLQSLLSSGVQLGRLLDTDMKQLAADGEAMGAPLSSENGPWATAREELVGGMKMHVEELRGEAMRELQGMLDSTAGALGESASALGESLGVDVDGDALSADCKALDHPICGLLKDVASSWHAKSKAELWHVREVACLAALRVIEAIDRAMTDAVNEDQLSANGSTKADGDGATATKALQAQREHELAVKLRTALEDEVAALRAKCTRGGAGAVDALITQKLAAKEEELREYSLGGARYVPPKVLSSSERQSALLEVKEALLKAVLRRRCIERSKSVRSLLRGGESCAAELNRLALSSDAAKPYELLPPNEQLATQMEVLTKSFESMREQVLDGVRQIVAASAHDLSRGLAHVSPPASPPDWLEPFEEGLQPSWPVPPPADTPPPSPPSSPPPPDDPGLAYSVPDAAHLPAYGRPVTASLARPSRPGSARTAPPGTPPKLSATMPPTVGRQTSSAAHAQGISKVAALTRTPLRQFEEHATETLDSLKKQEDRITSLMRDELLPSFMRQLSETLGDTVGSTACIAENLDVTRQTAVETGRKVEEEKQAWSTVQNEIVADITTALDELDDELSLAEGEDDPLVRMQGLIRCRDKKEALNAVMAQTKVEASMHLDGGAEDAAIQMKPAVTQLADVSKRADSMIADELRVLRGALESMEALLHENMAKLNEYMSRPTPDLSPAGLSALLKEQMSGLGIDDEDMRRLLATGPDGLKGEYGDRGVAVHKKLVFDGLKEMIEEQSTMVANRRLGASNSFMLHQAAVCDGLHKHTLVTQPISDGMPPAEIELEVSACVTGIQARLHELQARYEAEVKRLETRLALELSPLEHRYEAEVTQRQLLEAELKAEKAKSHALEAELARQESAVGRQR